MMRRLKGRRMSCEVLSPRRGLGEIGIPNEAMTNGLEI